MEIADCKSDKKRAAQSSRNMQSSASSVYLPKQMKQAFHSSPWARHWEIEQDEANAWNPWLDTTLIENAIEIAKEHGAEKA
jgi:D-hexose-6-phosphate mutarotase